MQLDDGVDDDRHQDKQPESRRAFLPDQPGGVGAVEEACPPENQVWRHVLEADESGEEEERAENDRCLQIHDEPPLKSQVQ